MQVGLEESRPIQAAVEILVDRIKQSVAHMADPEAIALKPCEVTVKAVVTPNASRTQFAIAVTGSTKFSPKQGYEATLFANVEDSENVTFFEYNPAQATIEQAIQDASKEKNN